MLALRKDEGISSAVSTKYLLLQRRGVQDKRRYYQRSFKLSSGKVWEDRWLPGLYGAKAPIVTSDGKLPWQGRLIFAVGLYGRERWLLLKRGSSISDKADALPIVVPSYDRPVCMHLELVRLI
jgi:hypothetical protein